ncbi:MAG: ComF family protein [Gammaproteobacteria bacterium]|nr:ComF family protein [Gammaproteobacteria bacterium]
MLKQLWPTRCLICLQVVTATWDFDHLCQACFNLLPWNNPACARCATPLPLAQPYCARCLNKSTHSQSSIILFHYSPPISDWIHAAKFENSFIHCRLLGQLLSHTLATQRTVPWPHCLIPMPLHPRRLRQRGYNQTIEIARSVGTRFAIPMDNRLLQRHRYSKPQSELSLKERHDNVHHSFRVVEPLRHSHFALIDDVTTTGNTLEAAASALVKAGPLQLEYWCIAKPF